MLNKNNNTMRVYGCGGLGVNVATEFLEQSPTPNTADILPTFIDTSRSNFSESHEGSDVFILPNTDGSGKVRSENHEDIAGVINNILLQFEPTSFNVVVFSASGGSGSVIGPLIMGELLARGLSAVCIVIGSDESIITANNTLNTIKSLDHLARRNELPLVAYYDHNDRKRSVVNGDINNVINALSILASGGNDELDSKDIENWVQFSKTTIVEPQLALLEIFNTADAAATCNDPISIASVYSDKDADHLKLVPEYTTIGYIETANEKPVEMHYIISISGVPNIASGISAVVEKCKTRVSSRATQATITSSNDGGVSDTGLVL